MDARNYAFAFYAAERHVVERTYLAWIYDVFNLHLAVDGVFADELLRERRKFASSSVK